MKYAAFLARAGATREDFCRQMLQRHRESIKPKKEAVALKNLGLILDATLRLGNRKGFKEMTVRDLSRESGLSMGALYDYFSGKDELLQMIQAAGRALTRRILREGAELSEYPAENLALVIRRHIYLSEAMQEWFFFSYMEARHLGQVEKERAMESELYMEGILAGIIRRGNRRGVFHAPDPRLAAALIKAMMQDWYLKRWKYARRGVGVARYANRVVEAALDICRVAALSRGKSGEQGE